MRYSILLVIILFVSLTVSAGNNVPGYQGKKFIIKYDCGIMHPFLMGRSGKLPELYHNLSMDYVVSRAWSVGGKYGFMHYNAATDKKTFYGREYYQDIEDNFPAGPESFKGRYMQHTVAFIAKHYYKRRGYIAPVGRYITLGVYYQYTSQHLATIDGTSTTDIFGNTRYEYDVQGYKAITHWGGFIFGMGRSMVVAKRMVIDVGFNLNIAPWPVYVFGDDTTVKASAYRELLLRNIFQVYLGFGALAF